MSESSVEGLVESGFEEEAGLGLGAGELGLQTVADGHQFVHFGDDAVLVVAVPAEAFTHCDGQSNTIPRMPVTRLTRRCVAAGETADRAQRLMVGVKAG